MGRDGIIVDSETLVISRVVYPTWAGAGSVEIAILWSFRKLEPHLVRDGNIIKGGKPHLGRGGDTASSDILVTSRAGNPMWAGAGIL